MPEIPERDGKITRRSAIQISAVGCTGAVIASSVPAQLFSPRKISIEQWKRLIGQDLVILQKSFEETPSTFRPATLRLVVVLERKTKTQPGQDLPSHLPRQSISLCFRSDLRTQLPSATFDVRHEAIGTRQLFINEIRAVDGEHLRAFESILN